VSRPLGVVLGLALAGWGCALLDPYPGGGDPKKVIGDPNNGKFQGGEEQQPLFDPAIDDSVVINSRLQRVVAIPGSAFTVDLGFIAQNDNVVGGGIQWPGSDEVQWTFIEGLEGLSEGDIQFGYVVAREVCGQIPNLCHAIETKQFAVARNNGGGDVDGNGTQDGEFVVSAPEDVTVIVQCATCESQSCQDLLDPADCFYCVQPDVCVDYFDRCLAEGRPNAGTDEADLFETFFGPDGVLWSSMGSCASGEAACEKAQENAETMPDECGI
jgi:hypothetical protein